MTTSSTGRPTRVLLTGATGFVGTHVYPVLVAKGLDVVCATRDVDKARAESPEKTFCQLDLESPASVERALADVDRAVYLVHSMGAGEDYPEREQRNARTFRDAAARRGLERIVYLGGMRPTRAVSRHLASRLLTGETLREGEVPTIELQATMIVGGGSESFRIVRDLAARLPWMLLPSWLDSMSEPVAIADIAHAIAHALTMPEPSHRVLSAPGPEKLRGCDIILRTAHALHQSPRTLRVPFVTPRLSSYWIRLVTRANPHVATELVEGLRSSIVARGAEVWSEMPDYARTPFDAAVRAALAQEALSIPGPSRMIERLIHGITRRDSSDAYRASKRAAP